MSHENARKWPKKLPRLTEEQRHIRDEFMRLWHEELPKRYGLIEKFNHRYPLRSRRVRVGPVRTLEIGAGIGGHIEYEDLRSQEYHALELRPEMACRIQERFPSCNTVLADCQRRLPYPDGTFDRVLAIHVLEHLPDLPAAVREVRRVMKADGVFSVVIPCEGGFLYRMARNVSARRVFERRFKQPYDWLIRSEHVNLPEEIGEELMRHFKVVHRVFFPFLVPSAALNLCIGLTLRPSG